jgi:hypothetical protein
MADEPSGFHIKHFRFSTSRRKDERSARAVWYFVDPQPIHRSLSERRVFGIYGRSPTGSHGHLNVGSAPDKGPPRADDVGRVVGLSRHWDGRGSTSAMWHIAEGDSVKQADGL